MSGIEASSNASSNDWLICVMFQNINGKDILLTHEISPITIIFLE